VGCSDCLILTQGFPHHHNCENLAYFHIILRYNLFLVRSKTGGEILDYSIDSISVQLAEILTGYLKNNWVNSPSTGKTITPETNMVTELQLDSFQVMEYMLEVEDHFDVAIDLESLSNIQTINDLANVVIAAHKD